MPDMLVKNYALPDSSALYERVKAQGILLKQAIPPELHRVAAFARENFSKAWESEVHAAFSHLPPSCFIAIENKQIVGFACCEATNRGYFGPTGVLESHRGREIGKALLMMALEHMRSLGYGYTIIGGAGPTGFYRKACGATAIPGSVPGIYKDMLW